VEAVEKPPARLAATARRLDGVAIAATARY